MPNLGSRNCVRAVVIEEEAYALARKGEARKAKRAFSEVARLCRPCAAECILSNDPSLRLALLSYGCVSADLQTATDASH